VPRVKWVRSAINCPKDQKAALKALGLTRLRQERVLPDHPAVWGQIRKVIHLVEVKDEAR
jgi:large subunit ribosomal protein L30